MMYLCYMVQLRLTQEQGRLCYVHPCNLYAKTDLFASFFCLQSG